MASRSASTEYKPVSTVAAARVCCVRVSTLVRPLCHPTLICERICFVSSWRTYMTDTGARFCPGTSGACTTRRRTQSTTCITATPSEQPFRFLDLPLNFANQSIHISSTTDRLSAHFGPQIVREEPTSVCTNLDTHLAKRLLCCSTWG